MSDIEHLIGRSGLLLAACLLLATTGCVQVDSSKDGKNKDVRVSTPMGGVHVKTNDMAASDIGLPQYPGSTQSKDKAADVNVGFGEWQMHLKVVKYHTPDSSQQVMAFYHKALGRYGDVIQCSGHTAVGTPVTTREGLGCRDDESIPKGSHPDFKLDSSAELKAGSKKHQHLVGIENSNSDGTDFSLVVLDLPSADSLPGTDKARQTN